MQSTQAAHSNAARASAPEKARPRDGAIGGIGCRFPGAANNPKRLWDIPGAFVLNGPLDEAVFALALRRMVARHEILQTHLYVDADGAPRQRVAASAPIDYRHAVPKLPDAGFTPAELEAMARNVVNTPFDLLNGPAWRAALIRTGTEQHLLALSFHHIVFDGWSLGLFARELFESYALQLQAKASGAETHSADAAAPLQYTDYMAWQAVSFDAAARARETIFWQTAPAGQPAPLDLPADRSRPAEQTFAGAMVKRVLPRALLDRVKQLAASESCTPFGVFLAAYQVLLHRYTGADDLTVGTPVVGRSVEAIEPMIGVFVNTLPIRVRLGTADNFRGVLQHMRSASLDAFSHATLPFDEIVEAVKPELSAAHHPVFQALFTYQNAIARMQTGPLGVAYMDVDIGTSKFDLSLDVFEGAQGPTCLFEYNTDLFDRARIERLAEHFETLLSAAVEAPDRPVSQLRLLSDDELDIVCGSVVELACTLPFNPGLPTAALRSSQATLAAVDNSAPLANRPESTNKSGKVVQTTGATCISKNELLSFMKIMNDLSFATELMPTVNKVVAHTNLLIPFEKCIASYELTVGGKTESFDYEFSDSSLRVLKKLGNSGISGNLYSLLRNHHKSETFQNTFFWCKNNKGVDENLCENLKRFGLSQGSGGSIIFYGSDRTDGVTLIQLHYSNNQIENKHLWFMNYFGPQLHTYFGRCVEHSQSSESKAYKLTPKEKEVIRWAGEGKTSWEIGIILSISERTVKFHLRNIYIKFNVINRAQAVTLASRSKLI